MKRLLASKKLKAALVLAAMTTNMMATVAFGETASNEVFFKIGEASYVANGVELEMDSAAVIHNSRTMVPMRYAAEAFGAEVSWDKETRTAIITHGEKEIRLPIDGNVIHIGEEHIEMDTKAVVIEGRTMLPLAYIAQALGLSTSWDAETQTVKITQEVVEAEEATEEEEVTEAEEVVEAEGTETEEAAETEEVEEAETTEEAEVQE